jgi:hypothetical protein
MGFIAALFSFIVSLFRKSRSGLEKFLKQNLEFVKDYLETYGPVALHAIKQDVFNYLRDKFPASVPDTWISMIIDFAFEHLKKERLK